MAKCCNHCQLAILIQASGTKLSWWRCLCRQQWQKQALCDGSSSTSHLCSEQLTHQYPLPLLLLLLFHLLIIVEGSEGDWLCAHMCRLPQAPYVCPKTDTHTHTRWQISNNSHTLHPAGLPRPHSLCSILFLMHGKCHMCIHCNYACQCKSRS